MLIHECIRYNKYKRKFKYQLQLITMLLTEIVVGIANKRNVEHDERSVLGE